MVEAMGVVLVLVVKVMVEKDLRVKVDGLEDVGMDDASRMESRVGHLGLE